MIFVDLLGGTPCNQVMSYIQESGQVLDVVKVKRDYFMATLGVTIISLILGCLGIII